MKPIIDYDDFAKLEIRMGMVVEAAMAKGSTKLIRQVVDFGPELGKRVIFSGILAWYTPETLVGKQLPYLINLAPRPMMGEESQGMLLAVAPRDGEGSEPSCVLLVPDTTVAAGTDVI